MTGRDPESIHLTDDGKRRGIPVQTTGEGGGMQSDQTIMEETEVGFADGTAHSGRDDDVEVYRLAGERLKHAKKANQEEEEKEECPERLLVRRSFVRFSGLELTST